MMFSSSGTRRVVVTGCGLVTPLGCGNEVVWKKLLDGECGIGKWQTSGMIGEIPIKLAAKVPCGENPTDFNPSYSFGRNVDKEISLFSQFAMVASDLALSHANINLKAEIGFNLDRAGVAVASGIGSISDITDSFSTLQTSYRRLSPYFVPKILINMAAGQVSIRHGFRGPNHSVSTACAAGAHAIGDAYNWIRLGYADIMLAGGTEACINPLAISGFSRMKALSLNEDPLHASRPFDVRRDGFVIGEGAGIVVLEELSMALARNAPIIAELCGYGVSGDAYHATSPSKSGDGACRAMQVALQDANITPSNIHYLNAHATSTPVGDEIETHAIETVFSSQGKNLLVSSTKGATGHLLGAAGAVEGIFTALAMRDGLIPATLNLHEPDRPTSFSHVALKSQSLDRAIYGMSNSFGFGGTNACLIFRKFNN